MNTSENTPLLAIHCLAYNHEPYIRDCLEGFVMQKTNFKFVAIVHDDASTDGTADIIREYETKYPEIIKPIYETENQYSKKDGSLDSIMNNAIHETGAKYVAMCEGDDYWTNPNKLQNQVDFLESHEDFSMCFHSATIRKETSKDSYINCENLPEKEYFTKDIFPKWVVPTASVVFRKSMADSYKPLKKIEWAICGDIILFLKCTHTGRVWCMNDAMSVYRVTETGAVLSFGKLDPDVHYPKSCNHYRFIMLNFPQVDKKWPNNFIATYYYSKSRRTKNPILAIKSLMIAFHHSPKYVLKKLFRMHPQPVYD